MNGKKARHIRNMAKIYTIELPVVIYEDVKQKLSTLKRIDRAIKYDTQPDVGDKYERRLGLKCQRNLYQRIKKRVKGLGS